MRENPRSWIETGWIYLNSTLRDSTNEPAIKPIYSPAETVLIGVSRGKLGNDGKMRQTNGALMRRFAFNLVVCSAITTQVAFADPVTLSCKISNRSGDQQTAFQLVFEDGSQTVTVNNGAPIHASITTAVIAYRISIGTDNTLTTIERTSGAVTVTLDKGLLMMSGKCVKVDPEHRAF